MQERELTLEEALARAVAAHRLGRLEEAERLYQAILEVAPDQFDALHLLGAIRHQQGRNQEAVERISAALARNPDSAEARSNLGLALAALGRQDEALASYEAALALRPEYPEALHNRGLALGALRRHREALESHERALALRPDYPEALDGRGLALRALGRRPEALASCERALALRPGSPDLLANRGNHLQSLGRHAEALASYEQALALRPDHAGTLYNRGLAVAALGRFEDALASYGRALELAPGFVEALIEQGVALDALGRHEAAIESYDRALELDPEHHAALNNRGNALHALERHEEALASYELALASRPGSPEALDNRGIVLQSLNRLEEALTSHERALEIHPDYPEALCNRATAFWRLGRTQEAIAGYERAQAARPGYAEAHWYEGEARLSAGDFTRGWPGFEWRWKAQAFTSPRRSFPQPLWRGDLDLAGKVLLLHAEQALGDTIQFVRYAQLAAERGARVVLEVHASLKTLCSGMEGVDRTLARGEPLPDFDLHCPLMSLPHAFGTTLASIPPPARFSGAWSERVPAWRARLGGGEGVRVGLVWWGARRPTRNRSIALETLGPLFTLPGLRFVSLQKELRDRDRALLGEGLALEVLDPEFDDFADTAAALSLMDLVISIDTSVAHLAGSLGRPVWILLPFASDWRWLRDRDDSPWYPTARLFRQERIGDWDAVVRRVGDALRGWLQHETRSSRGPRVA